MFCLAVKRDLLLRRKNIITRVLTKAFEPTKDDVELFMTSYNEDLRAYMSNVWVMTGRWLRRAGHVAKLKGTRVRTLVL